MTPGPANRTTSIKPRKRLWPTAGDVGEAPGFRALRSLRGRMALLFGLAIVPLGLLTFNEGLGGARIARIAAKTDAAQVARADLAGRQNEITRLRAMTRTLSANVELGRTGVARCNSILLNVRDEFRELSLLTVLDSHGKVICASDTTRVGRATAAAPLIARAQQTNDVVMDYFAAPLLVAEPVVAALAPIGQTAAPDRLYVAASRTFASLFARPPSYKNGFSALADGQGKILQISGLDRESDAFKRLQYALKPGVLREAALIEARDTWAVAAPLIEGSLYVVQGGPAGPLALGDILRTSWALLAPILTWLAAVAVAWLIAELNIVRPLTTLEKLARGYARGEENITPASFASAPDEIASLRRTMAAMAKIMRGREQRLSEALQEERALLRELHHRVNNNLQLVASLLSIQSRAAPNAEQKLGFVRAHESIQLLAMVQKRIYASGEVHENISLEIMAGDIARMMVRSRGEGFALELRLEPAYVAFDHAVFWTFLIGESLSFALDHLEGGPKTPLIVSVRNNNGAVEFSVSAPGAILRNVEASAARRIIDAFSREVGATITYDQDDPLGVRLVANAADAPEQVLADS